MDQLNANQLKQVRANLMLRLGEEAYRVMRGSSGQLTQLMFDTAMEIRQTDVKIAAAMDILTMKKGICPSCGTKMEDGNLFCPSCGLSVRDYEAKYVGSCPTCQAKAVAGQNFCEICGTRLR